MQKFSKPFITPDTLVEGDGRVQGGLVRTLSVDCDAKSGAPILTLYFVDARIAPAEFAMDVKSACRLFVSLVSANKAARWESRKSKDHLAKDKATFPLDVEITQCGVMRDVKLRVDMETGNTQFTVDLRRGKVGTLDFTFDPAICLSLLVGLYDLYEHFGWKRVAGARATLN